jgi:hypothetical protein
MAARQPSPRALSGARKTAMTQARQRLIATIGISVAVLSSPLSPSSHDHQHHHHQHLITIIIFVTIIITSMTSLLSSSHHPTSSAHDHHHHQHHLPHII